MASDRTPQPLPANVICYGDSHSLPRQIPLRAGPLELVWEDGTLRRIVLGKCELLKQVYAAIRDPSWETIPGQISNVRVDRSASSFLIRFRSTHRASPIHFVWDGRIEGSPAGIVRFEMRGVARSTFRRARIGLCVLHPADTCAGVPCSVIHDDAETSERARFPLAIAPEAPVTGFHSMRGMSFEAEPGVRVQLRFEGDVFEMEDQRNWTDASFKTFSTPLHLPIPVEVERGSRVEQSFSLELSGSIPERTAKRVSNAPTTLTLSRKSPGKTPRVGLGTASHGIPLSSAEVRRLSRLGLSHLRVDVNLADADWKGRLLTAVADARELGVALEVALLNHRGALPDELAAVVSGAKISTWLLFPDDRSLAAEIQRQFPESRIAAGTDANFISFNESPPKSGHIDVATFAIHPQTHATDNDSLIETLEIQGQLVSHASKLMGGLPVMVSPITLKPRFNPDAIGPEAPPAPGRLPPQVDVRQMSLFGACWTLGSMKYLAEAGVESTTWFETTGWRGVLERRQGSLLPKVFRSLNNGVFPIYFVFAWLADFGRAVVLPLRSDSPLRVAGFAVRRQKYTRMMLANFTGSVQSLVFQGAPDSARVLILDEHNAVQAMTDPESFLRRKGRVRRLEGLTLPRYSLARLDVIQDDQETSRV